MHSVTTHHCRVERLEKVTHDVIIMNLALDSGEPFAFAAGQYMSLHFDGLPPRDFSLANLPGETPLEFHVRQAPGGTVGHHLVSQLRVGDQAPASRRSSRSSRPPWQRA
jgi:ferredoxin-NAD(P)+ reductase (naphthalene dioxygenase ferredoxin-specific)